MPNPITAVARIDLIHQQIEEIEAQMLEGESTGEIPSTVFDSLVAFTTAEAQHVDDAAMWMSRIEGSIDFLREQERFLRAKRQFAENALATVKATFHDFLKSRYDETGKDSDKKLHGVTRNIWIQRNGAKSLVITNPENLPLRYSNIPVTVDISADDPDTLEWLRSVLDSHGVEHSVGEARLVESRVREDLEADKAVPGAELVEGYHTRFSKPRKLTEKKPKAIEGNGPEAA